jgi:hypothetical protein
MHGNMECHSFVSGENVLLFVDPRKQVILEDSKNK